VFFGEDRYHMVVVPALCILAASALRPGTGMGGTFCEPLQILGRTDP
jgi:hypothetical protein